VQDWRPLLDRELQALPAKYKTPVLLCDLEGKTRREAARQLGISEGTLSSRLARARCLLARRLVKHGVTLSGGALAAALAESTAAAAVPAAWVSSTVQTASLLAAGSAAAVATPAAALMNEVSKAMLMTKLKLPLVAMMLAVLLGAGSLVYRAAGQAPADGRDAGKPRSELEALRHEVELLRFNLEVILEKCRAQEAELRSLRAGRDAAAAATRDAARVKAFLDQQLATVQLDEVQAAKLQELVKQQQAAARQQKDAADAAAKAAYRLRLVDAALDPAAEIEAALKVYREASDKDAKLRAAEKLEKALKKLKQKLEPKPDLPVEKPH
jgi:hypothetical protein